MNGDESITTGMGASESAMLRTTETSTTAGGESQECTQQPPSQHGANGKRKPDDEAMGNGSSSSALNRDHVGDNKASEQPPMKKRRSLDLLSAAAFGMEEMETPRTTDHEESANLNDHSVVSEMVPDKPSLEMVVSENKVVDHSKTMDAIPTKDVQGEDISEREISKESVKGKDDPMEGTIAVDATVDGDSAEDPAPTALADVTDPKSNDFNVTANSLDLDKGNDEFSADEMQNSENATAKANQDGDEENNLLEDQSENKAEIFKDDIDCPPEALQDENGKGEEALTATAGEATREGGKLDTEKESPTGTAEDETGQSSTGDEPISAEGQETMKGEDESFGSDQQLGAETLSRTGLKEHEMGQSSTGIEAIPKPAESQESLDGDGAASKHVDTLKPAEPASIVANEDDVAMNGAFNEGTTQESSEPNIINDNKVESSTDNNAEDISNSRLKMDTAVVTTSVGDDLARKNDLEESASQLPMVIESTNADGGNCFEGQDEINVHAASGNEDEKVLDPTSASTTAKTREGSNKWDAHEENESKSRMEMERDTEMPDSNGAHDESIERAPVHTVREMNGSSTGMDRPSDEDPNDTRTANESSSVSNRSTELSQSQKGKTHIRKKHVDPETLEIRRRIQVGCRDNDLASAMEAYEDAMAKDIRLEAQSFYNLLNLCDGLERTVHIGTPISPSGSAQPASKTNVAPRRVDDTTRQQYAFRLKDHMKDLKYPLNETAYSALVKMLARNKNFESAASLLSEAEQVQQCKAKLRLYSSLLIAYCDERRMLDALDIWQRLTKRNLQATEREYTALMRCATATGDSVVVRRVLTDLAENVRIPSKETVASLIEWFELAHSFYSEALTKKRSDASKVKDYLDEIHKDAVESSPDMGPVVNAKGWRMSSACPVDTRTGAIQTGCLKGYKLLPASLSERAWNEMRCMNAKIVIAGEVEGSKSHFQGGKKGKKRMKFSPDERKQQWDRFAQFLDSVGQVDVVIDGANVGKFEQNFADAPRHVDYNQIDWVVQQFKKMGKRVLLVLHERHFSENMMPDKYRPLQESWERENLLYKTPRGMNDDWFWLHAAYSYKSLVVTNDEMRDHHFQMLAPRTFLRWKERHHVHFDFGDWMAFNGSNRQREVKLTWPEPYSRRIQRVDDGLVVPLAKQGDDRRFLDGAHIACDDEPLEETYLCIRPSSAK